MHYQDDSPKNANENGDDMISHDDENPYFKDVWDNLERYEEEYTPSNDIIKYHSHLQKSLYNILFSIKYFHDINIDSHFLKLVNKYVKLKLQGNQTDEKDISRLARFHLKSQKEDDDEDELVVDEEIGAFPTKCPISQMPFENPVTQRFSKNRKACVHTFENSFILRLIQNKDTIECPIAACKKKVYRNSLHPDYELLHHSRFMKFRDNITEAKEYFEKLRNDEDKCFNFVE
ncbi:E3 SUMO-protein ligase NSE2, putative [Plasmodium berghei]|uniref:E3 SUMO-protein ligase NSE2, putative n=2 Tax=Plasmodium berghei TaxID=5821 RepID=A0A509APF2_PLABA|nr:E3 SUMO-protein ligase NSE2, putative [Plasmodium berghei ANKA]CXI91392.1 E3 SUMO-protein ligase NSE2, putative [Plasmodium berghei]SCL96441.1 E3 SUMO-protein ligase NSE2, putative [Plasmodium berghei]SCM16425.1 E3 SUMO-protein ligase NSE2, putative [Plasmodium berghei]SCM18219.1 E3 SUMO-protein ligase NSE2, putative [Plasmodium berghei]SCN27647.1 E3 SUMO-protein ligase NSE2, putative [Plasmodium berghei]|eukprot:XP_034423302.1 E3 SUMO-protein ligase NSE2, putative [Plasmodium berghei ANKA]